ncbi:hypothetical protein HDU99_007611 [Rhizoclosmatium hyalinum]|nr:hypothetical protein HDU99_007611 [Rhizoclosmatium hyalinum]
MLFFLLVSFLSAVYGKTKSDGKIVVAYLTDWSGYDASKIDYTIVTNVHYSFATLTEKGGVNIPSGLSPSLVDTVHAGGAVISLAIGGDGGSAAYKKAVTPSVRQTTINSIANVISKYRLDGVDIDWEFPQKDDYDNYLAFLVALRKKLGPNAWISACTNVFPFIGKDGNYVKDASEFAKVLSFIFIMAYDINGSWNSITAPNAPLEDKSGNSPIDVKGSVQNWRKARFPYNQIVLGVPL